MPHCCYILEPITMTLEDNQTLKNLEKKLEQIRISLEIMKKSGVDEEILITWLQAKTKLSQKDIKLMLKSTEEFYSKLLKKEMLGAFNNG